MSGNNNNNNNIEKPDWMPDKKRDRKKAVNSFINKVIAFLIIAFCIIIVFATYYIMARHMSIGPIDGFYLEDEVVGRTKAATVMIYTIPILVFCALIGLIDLFFSYILPGNKKEKLIFKNDRNKFKQYSDKELMDIYDDLFFKSKTKLPGTIEYQVEEFNMDKVKFEIDFRKKNKTINYLKNNIFIFIIIAVVFFIIGNAWR